MSIKYCFGNLLKSLFLNILPNIAFCPSGNGGEFPLNYFYYDSTKSWEARTIRVNCGAFSHWTWFTMLFLQPRFLLISPVVLMQYFIPRQWLSNHCYSQRQKRPRSLNIKRCLNTRNWQKIAFRSNSLDLTEFWLKLEVYDKVESILLTTSSGQTFDDWQFSRLCAKDIFCLITKKIRKQDRFDLTIWRKRSTLILAVKDADTTKLPSYWKGVQYRMKWQVT